MVEKKPCATFKPVKDKEIYDFSGAIERMDVEWTWDFVEVPAEISQEIRAKKWKRLCVSIQDLPAYSAALMPLSEGRRGILISQARQKELGAFLGAWIQIRLWEDQSKYGMPVPEELAELFEFDPAIETAFEKLLPGRRRNYLHHIASAKTEATRTKRVLKLLKDLGIDSVG